jgi:hypothetical protein
VIAAGPDHAEAAAITQDPGYLRDGPLGIHPVPRRRDEHAVRAGVRHRDRLAHAVDDAHARRVCLQHRPHPRVGLDRHDLRDLARQGAVSSPVPAARSIASVQFSGSSQSTAASGGLGRSRS